jgi:hypothetical protein
VRTGILATACGNSETNGAPSSSRFTLHSPIPSADITSVHTRPHPYLPSLTPLPSTLRPHCLARDRLRLWLPPHGRSSRDHTGSPLPLSDVDFNRILTVIGHSLASGTRETYGSGLLVFHVFCDARHIPEDQRGPASSVLILAFIASCAGLYSGKTLENYLYGVRAWHLLHGLPWFADPAQVASALTGGARLAPPSSTRPKRHPFTVTILVAIRSVLDLSDPLDSAVYACLLTSFFSLARVGEVTVRSLTAFRPFLHVKVSDIQHDADRHGYKVTILHLPHTKVSPSGEDVYFAAHPGAFDPLHALANHLTINQPPPSAHLFSWKHRGGLRPLTRSEFLRTLTRASSRLGIEPLNGHGIRIGGTLEYLLRGVPFDTVKCMGRWSSDAFVGYLRQHAVVMAPYLQDTPILEPFTRYALPPVR